MAPALRPPAFRGRSSERQALDRPLADARGSRSGVLVVRGEAGMGMSAPMHHAAGQGSGFQLVEIPGVESEIELPYAELHQLCAGVRSGVDALPGAQRDALRVALRYGPSISRARSAAGRETLGPTPSSGGRDEQ